MAEPEAIILEDGGDEEMDEAEIVEEVEVDAEDGEPTGLEDVEPPVSERVTFLDINIYLRSPIVELALGSSAEATTLSAHQGLLTLSPYFAEACAQFSDNTVRRRIELPNDDLEAASSVLEYLYKDDYFPNASGNNIDYDPSIPQPDNGGVALLRHARVYTLAQRFGLPQLASLAHKKIHLTQSTAKGEIAYARFVYKETSPDGEAIRRPVAAFWATRSHVLRHEAEQEFKRMCLGFPQFGFDVLSLVLDQQEKRSARPEVQVGPGAGRKRQRVSQA